MIEFTKMHGLGNDFVVISTLHQSVPHNPKFITDIAHRHAGIGCDQVLMIGATKNPLADFSYRIFNADGTEVYQCGNGARCVGLFIRQKKLSDKKTIVLETKYSTMKVTCRDDQQVEVDIAVPCFDAKTVPFLPDIFEFSYPFDVVNVGNPHCVVEVAGLSAEMMQKIGLELNAHSAFPEGVNVGFVQVQSRSEIHLCVYERGAGMTQACGSGACAAVAVLRRHAKVDSIVTVHQPGGQLTITWEKPTDCMRLMGPAVTVFDGLLISKNEIE